MQIILREIRNFFRNKSNLFFTCIFPVILVYLLGTMLQNIQVSEYEIGTLNAGYIIDTTDISAMALPTFIEEMNKSEDIKFSEVSSTEKAIKMVKDGELTAAVVFSGNPMKVEVYGSNDKTQCRAIKSIVDSYLTTAGAFEAVLTESPMTAAGIEISDEDMTIQKECVESRTMIDYYSVSMIVMIMFMGGLISACGGIQDDRKGMTLRRIYASPKNKTTAFLQIIIGTIPYAMLQIIITMTFSTLFFKAKYCADIKGNLMLFFMLFVVSMALIAFSALLGLVCVKFNPQVFAMAGAWFILFFSGSFAKNVHIDGFSDYLPPYIVQNAAFDLTIFGRYDAAIRVTAVSAVIFLILMIVGTLIFNRKGEDL